ncbi:MAG: M23 family metallopeptidase [bacterium]|nr:M23 family metallopeptidase [bacterium]
MLKIENRVRRGDTIINALKREGIGHQTAYKFFTDIKPVYNLRKINAGKKYALFLSPPANEIKKFTYEIDVNQYLEVSRDNLSDRFTGKIVTIPYEVRKEVIKGEISYSLFESILECGEKPELADILASLYEYDVDFNRDIQPNDSFSVIVEKKYLEGKFAAYGDVLATEFVNRGKTIRIIQYTDPEGNTAYYHPDGRSVRKMFLRCPLPFMRVTSRYGNRRHPVLGFSAKHNGVDFAAPRGTKIRASASGVVLRVGYQRYKGRYITIRHPNRYVSEYYHLSRRAKNIRSGVKVEQGQIIGYVGSTGLSTGPHLHYGLRKNGRFINPLRLKSPTKNPVKKTFLEDFKRYTARHFLVISGSRLVSIPQNIQDALLAPSPASM